MNAYEAKAGVVCLQCKSCVSHTWALQKWCISLEALYKCHTFTFTFIVGYNLSFISALSDWDIDRSANITGELLQGWNKLWKTGKANNFGCFAQNLFAAVPFPTIPVCPVTYWGGGHMPSSWGYVCCHRKSECIRSKCFRPLCMHTWHIGVVNTNPQNVMKTRPTILLFKGLCIVLTSRQIH